MKKLLALAALALTLSACAAAPDADPKTIAQQRVDEITIAYAAVHSVAMFCTSGVICEDAAVIAAVQAGLAAADVAVDEGKKLILANATDSSAVAKYSRYALSAITVLTKAMQSFGIKVA